jgi:hypothetical protein
MRILSALDLGFPTEIQVPKEGVWLGKEPELTVIKISKLAWEISAWVLVSLGIFIRQGIDIPALAWHIDHLSLGAFLASVAIALAVFPWFMRWFNKKRPKPGIEHIGTVFGFGFFLDLAKVSVFTISASVRGLI